MSRLRRRVGRSWLVALLASGLLVGGIMVSLPGTGAFFTNDVPVGGDIAAGRIFRDERVTPAFVVNDVSSGSSQSGSSADAFASDGRYFLTRNWPTTFSSSRYIDFEFNAPLPAGLITTTVALSASVSSDAGTGSVCVYAEVRRASTDALIASYGSAGSPLACTSGASALTGNISLPVGSTDVANDLRVRIFASDSAGGALRVDQMTITGSTPYASFTLYPILTRELFNGQQELLRWGLAG